MSLPPKLQRELCKNVVEGLNSSWEPPSTQQDEVMPLTLGYLRQTTGWIQVSVQTKCDEIKELFREFFIRAVSGLAGKAVSNAVQKGPN